MNRCLLFWIVSLSWCVTGAAASEPTFSADDFENFERKIRPILDKHCYSCHSSGAETVHAGLRLDSASDFQSGGDSGPVVIPGAPEESLLLSTIRYDGDIQMPPSGKLSESDIAELTAWVQRDAPFPPSTDDQATRPHGRIDFEAGRKFWSFQPASSQPLPEVAEQGWTRRRIDSFVLAAMEKEGLRPSPEADRATLIRRLSFDLIGLPPTPQQVQAFVTDDSPDAYERLVERLLQSPQYGERWARIWLDLARYTDRTASWLYENGQPHLYRDWVVQALNDDMPYDEFVHRQLATDLMVETGPEDVPALGFLGLSPSYWKELMLPSEIIKVIVADEWEERVDTVSRTFLGLTVACARCHDHKFDPISSEDYYALAGVFASCRLQERPLIGEERYEPVRIAKAEIEKLEAELAELKQETATESEPEQKEKQEDLTAKIEEIKSSTPFFDAPMASAVTEESIHVVRAGALPENGTRLDYRNEPRDLPVFIRGNPNRPGPVVRRRFLTVLSDQPQPFENGSGRLELARAITTDAAGLVARVLVNRVWLAHFGQGIVMTPSNFGQQGARPSHPELLEDLAAQFIANGWSIKDLHREILLSATWRQSSEFDHQKAATDPNNRWLSRMSRKRLDFESWRDAMLSVSGQLDRRIGGPSVDLEDSGNLRRTLYATVHRREMSTALQIHDFPDPNAHSPRRVTTTTALQGLYALNNPLLAAQSEALVKRLHDECGVDDRARITRAYWLLFARAPSERERQIALEYLGETSREARSTAWNQYAHMLLVSNEFLFLD